ALHRDGIVFASTQLFNSYFALLFRPAIAFFLTFLNQIKRRQRDVDITLLDQVAHIAEEEREDERPDVAAVHVRIGHDYDLVIAEFIEIECLGIFSRTERYTECGDNILDFFVVVDLMFLCLFHVQDLPSQGKDSLEHAVPTLLGGASRRIPLDEVELGDGRVSAGAVGKLSGKAGSREHILPLHHFTRLTGSVSRLSRQDNFVYDQLGFTRVFFQVILKDLADSLVYNTHHFRVAQLGLGLTFKLGLSYLHGDHRRESFAEVVAADVDLNLVEQA